MRRTGNPFVDMGLCALTVLAGVDNISNLSVNDLYTVFHMKYSGTLDIAGINSQIKSFTMVFGTNGPLYQNAFKPNNKNIYRNFLKALLDNIDNDKQDHTCEICGNKHDFDINITWRQVVEKYGVKVKEDKYIGRDFFPLIGSIGNDAQALPSASRTVNICPLCLFAVNYIPIATMLLKGRLICIESTDESLMLEMVNDIVYKNISRISIGESELYGKGEGNTEVVKKLLDIFPKLQSKKRIRRLPKSTALYIWIFSNSGTGADCDIIEIPNSCLRFLWEASTDGIGLENELLKLISKDKGGTLFDCIQYQQDYQFLYPYKNDVGASTRLYQYYQQHVVGRTIDSLDFARKVAMKMIEDKEEKEKKRLQRSDVFREQRNRVLAKKTMVELIANHECQLEDYLSLFNKHNEYLKFNYDGYNVIMYYLHHLDAPEIQEVRENMDLNIQSQQMDERIKEFAKCYFDYYVYDKQKGLGRGLKTFKENIIDKFTQYKEGWLRDNFAKMAAIYNSESMNLRNYDDWLDFITDAEGKKQVYELLFQLRLAFADLYFKNSREENDDE